MRIYFRRTRIEPGLLGEKRKHQTKCYPFSSLSHLVIDLHNNCRI